MKNIFSENEVQKVSEEYLRHVLVTSICSILLCMCCFVGATWAWYTVSVDNIENAIQVAAEPKAVVKINGEYGTELVANQINEVTIENIGDSDDFKKKSTLYVTLSGNGNVIGYVTLNHIANIQIETDGKCTLSFITSWFKPSGAAPLNINEVIAFKNTVKPVEGGPLKGTPQATETATTEAATESTEMVTTEETTESTEILATEENDPTEETTAPIENESDSGEKSIVSVEETIETTGTDDSDIDIVKNER